MDADARTLLAVTRKERGLSLRELASRVGISASQLSQIEKGRSEPSVASLFALVNELGLSLDMLITGQAEDGGQTAVPNRAKASDAHVPGSTTGRPQRRVLKRESDYQVLHLDSGVIWERMVASDDDTLETLRVTYQPGGRSSSDGSFSRHDGAEFIHMISGELTVHLRFEEIRLTSGDTLFFESSDPHYFVNDTDQPAVGIWVIFSEAGKAAASLGSLTTQGQVTPLRHHAGSENPATSPIADAASNG